MLAFSLVLCLFASSSAADVPSSDGASAVLVYDVGIKQLRWLYSSPGDYNQDGLVTINDLTPLGQNYEVEGPFAQTSALAVIDGNGDDWITINDITQIGQNYQKQVVGYKAYTSASQADYPAGNTAGNGEGTTLLGSVTFAQSTQASGARRVFRLTLQAPPASGFAWVRPVDADGAEGTPSNMIEFGGGGPVNTPPVASLDLGVSSVPPGTEVVLDASGSSDDDGDTLNYRFDPEGDGTFLGDSAEDTLTWTYTTLGDYNPAVRVEDGNGGADETSAALSVSLGTLEKHIIDAQCAPEQTGWHVSVVMSGDRPGVVYYDASADLGYTVRWCYPLTATCDSWGDQRGIGQGGTLISAATMLGKAAVACMDGSDILFFSCKNADGSGAWNAMEVAADASESGVPFFLAPALATINGSPALVCISAESLNGGSLYFNLKQNPSSFTWPAATRLLDVSADVIGTSSLCEVYSHPGIAYVTDTAFAGQIMYWRADDETGNSWSEEPVAVRPTARYTLSSTSLRMVLNRPALVYYNHWTDEVCYVRSRDSLGDVWGDPVIIDSDTNANGSIDLLVINGLPTIAYHKSSVGLCCAVAKDDAGEAWNDPVIVDADSGVGISVKLAEVDGRIAFAYHNTYRENVEFAVFR